MGRHSQFSEPQLENAGPGDGTRPEPYRGTAKLRFPLIEHRSPDVVKQKASGYRPTLTPYPATVPVAASVYSPAFGCVPGLGYVVTGSVGRGAFDTGVGWFLPKEDHYHLFSLLLAYSIIPAQPTPSVSGNGQNSAPCRVAVTLRGRSALYPLPSHCGHDPTSGPMNSQLRNLATHVVVTASLNAGWSNEEIVSHSAIWFMRQPASLNAGCGNPAPGTDWEWRCMCRLESVHAESCMATTHPLVSGGESDQPAADNGVGCVSIDTASSSTVRRQTIHG